MAQSYDFNRLGYGDRGREIDSAVQFSSLFIPGLDKEIMKTSSYCVIIEGLVIVIIIVQG